MNAALQRRQHDFRVKRDFCGLLDRIRVAVLDGRVPYWLIESITATTAWRSLCGLVERGKP